jgi:hypothetical protein
MATGKELAEHALELAKRCLTAHRGELTKLAAGDTEALANAAQLLRLGRKGASECERAAEHIADTLLTAAFAQLAEGTAT